LAVILIEHDLFRKPIPTFRDHALARERRKIAGRALTRKRIFRIPLVAKRFEFRALYLFARWQMRTASALRQKLDR
jgi:hypothetical protein